MLAYICAEPTKSKTNSNDIFGELYDEAFNQYVVTPEIIVAAHECYSEIEIRRQAALQWQASISRNSYEESWIVEGHFHVLFVVGELLRRTGRSLSDKEAAVSLIDTAIGIIQKFVSSHRETASYRLFRLASSREAIMKAIEGGETRSSNGYAAQLSLGI